MFQKIALLGIFFVSLLLLAAAPAQSHHTYPFPDVPSTHPYFPAIEYLRVRNVMSGYKDGKFKMSRDMNRAEAVVTVVKARGLDPSNTQYKKCFKDVKKEWFADEVCYAKDYDWLPENVGSNFKPGKDATFGFVAEVLSNAFSVSGLDIGFDDNDTMDRGRFAELLYRVMTQTRSSLAPLPLYSTPAQAPSSYITNPYSINVPPGYFQPWIPGTVSPSPAPTSYYSTYSNTSSTYACQAAGIVNMPTRSASNYSVNYCALDNTGAPSTQILLGQATLSNVWGESFSFNVSDKLRAMATGYASDMFDINPNYLHALAVKESKMNCSQYGGCFQIFDGFSEVKNRYPVYIDSGDTAESLVRPFETAVVVAGLYLRFGEALWDSLYQWRNFYASAQDQEARAKIVSRGYNRGLWDPAVRDMCQTNRSTCQTSSNVFSCFPSGHVTSPDGIARDHAESVVNYCRALVQSGNFYDTRLTRQDVTDFIERVLKPTFSQTSPTNWSVVAARANDAFTCLQTSDATISFRYDFKTLLSRVKQTLPLVPSPVM